MGCVNREAGFAFFGLTCGKDARNPPNLGPSSEIFERSLACPETRSARGELVFFLPPLRDRVMMQGSRHAYRGRRHAFPGGRHITLGAWLDDVGDWTAVNRA